MLRSDEVEQCKTCEAHFDQMVCPACGAARFPVSIELPVKSRPSFVMKGLLSLADRLEVVDGRTRIVRQ